MVAKMRSEDRVKEQMRECFELGEKALHSGDTALVLQPCHVTLDVASRIRSKRTKSLRSKIVEQTETIDAAPDELKRASNSDARRCRSRFHQMCDDLAEADAVRRH